MIDLHSHLLPGIDDGAQTLDDSIALARIALADGISHMVVTPHLHPGRYDNTPEIINTAYQRFEQALNEASLTLTVKTAAEVRLSAELLSLVEAEQVPFLGRWNGKKVMLLELPHSHVPPGTDKLIAWLQAKDILPMIAHPERNKGIMSDTGKMQPFVEAGCLFQLTAMSVAGKFGERAREVAHEFLIKGWVTVLATDAHNTKHRPPVLSEGRDAAAEVIGEAAANRLVVDNPARIMGLDE
jgi:protein-tyrosine phosphatase